MSQQDRLVDKIMKAPNPSMGVKQLMEAKRQARTAKYQRAYFETEGQDKRQSPTKYQKGLATGLAGKKRARSPGLYQAEVQPPNPYAGPRSWAYAAPMQQPKF